MTLSRRSLLAVGAGAAVAVLGARFARPLAALVRGETYTASRCSTVVGAHSLLDPGHTHGFVQGGGVWNAYNRPLLRDPGHAHGEVHTLSTGVCPAPRDQSVTCVALRP